MSARARQEIDELYRGHRDEVYRFLLRDLRDPDEAEDVTQTAFLQAYGSVLRGRHPERPRAWLLTIADNLRRRRFVRAANRPREVPLDDLEIAQAERPSVDELRAALEQLPFNQRAALVLREVAGLSYGEIASRLEVSVGSVQMLLFRARRKLRDELEATSRRVSSLLPPWLTTAFGHGDRLALPGRVAGVAIAVAIAATASAGSPFPVSPDPVHRVGSSPAVTPVARPHQTTPRAERAAVVVAKRPREETPHVAAPPREPRPSFVHVSAATSPGEQALELPSPLRDVPSVAVPEVAAPPLPLPSLALPVDVPTAPLPELPVLP